MKTNKKYSSVTVRLSVPFLILFVLFSNTGKADDSDIFVTGNVSNSGRTQVMILLDTSDSMSFPASGAIPPPYDPEFSYTGDHYNTSGSSHGSNFFEDNTFYDYPPERYSDIVDASDLPDDCRLSGHQKQCKGNYINWQYASRLDIAKATLEKIIQDNPNVDFGLAEFPTSGKIIHKHLKQRTATERSDLVNTILTTDQAANTPLCQTYQEVYKYFAGAGRTANADPEAKAPNNKYNSPVGTCQNLYVIVMTDGAQSGEPTASNDYIKNLTSNQSTCGRYDSEEICMPRLAEYLANPGTGGLDNDPATGTQKAYTYTIGYETDQRLLFDTANRGKGKCYTTVGNNTDPAAGCISVDNINDAFDVALQEILKGSNSFVSPAVAVNSFNRTETLDRAYFAMFEPDSSARWNGNLKKLKIYTGQETSGTCYERTNISVGSVVDRSCNKAIASGTTKLDSGISTFWNTISDGNTVNEGGLGTVLKNSNTSRTFYTNKVIGDTPEAMVGLNQLTHSDLGIEASESNRGSKKTNRLNWIKGLDNDGNTREWVLGDIQHSKPVTLNYGARTSSYSQENPDIRLAFGTNHGILHFIEDQGNTVVENWSFFAKETAGIIPALMENQNNISHKYGLDGEITVIRFDAEGDGNINSSSDRMVLVFGMRRGGDSYYALDVTNPDSVPKLLWRIDSSTPGFSELGQSWSRPVPLVIPGHGDILPDGESTRFQRKIALVFGAGYDGVEGAGPNKGKDDLRLNSIGLAVDEDGNNVRHASRRGRGLYIVDAGTGSLIQSFVKSDNNDSNDSGNRFEDSRFKWSIPAPPAVLDSNGDGLHDRIYAADTGGNIFRIDIGQGEDDNSNEIAIWSLITLAKLGINEHAGRFPPGNTHDRRFFYQPVIARTIYKGTPFDAVSLGSGDRANPSETTVADRFYMIRDLFTRYTRFGDCDDCVTAPQVIKHTQLHNASDNLVQQGNTDEKQAANSEIFSLKGWYMNLGFASGDNARSELSMTKGQILNGTLFFTTFSPAGLISDLSCTPGAGTSRFYGVNMQDASAVTGDDLADRIFGAFSGVSGEETFIHTPQNATDLDAVQRCVYTPEKCAELSSNLGMHTYGWMQEK